MQSIKKMNRDLQVVQIPVVNSSSAVTLINVREEDEDFKTSERTFNHIGSDPASFIPEDHSSAEEDDAGLIRALPFKLRAVDVKQ